MLHSLALGEGPELVMLHGWGMHGGIMRDFAERLAARFRVTLIDLPGHGPSGPIGDMSLQGMVDAVLERAPQRAHWLGWSLGASLSLEVANVAAARVDRVVLVAGTPRFVRDENWPGMEESHLLQFAQDLRNNDRQCLQRFLGLQVAGTEESRSLLKALRTRLAECESPDQDALEAGLSILRTADLRHGLGRLRVPVLAILGQRDLLVPVAVGEALRRANGRVEVRTVAGASHLPFWTHGDETLDAVEEFLLRRDA